MKPTNTLFTRPFIGKKLEMKHNWSSKIAVVAIALVTSLVQSVVKVSPVMVINAGHDLTLHRNAPALFATVIEWSNRVFKY